MTARLLDGPADAVWPDSPANLLQNHRMPASSPLPRPHLRIALVACLLVLAPMGMAKPTAKVPLDVAQAGRTVAAGYATGDAWIDGRLADIDRYAARHPDAFADELQRHAGVARDYTMGLLAQPGWRAGDAWYACFLGRTVQAGCRSVVRERSRAGTDVGWAEVAARFDAKVGSPAHAQLRLALADSYRRWDRPLQPDAALKRALRERDARKAADAAVVP